VIDDDMKLCGHIGALFGAIAGWLFGWWVVALIFGLMLIDAAFFFWRYRRIL
jgi:hypothetical protein